MSNIRFIFEGAQASSQASQLKQYLETHWQDTQLEIKVDPATQQDSHLKDIDFNDIRLIIEVYGIFKMVMNPQNEVEESKQNLQKLIHWIEKTLTLNGKVVWIEIGGIPYPLIAEKLDDISQALQKQDSLDTEA